MGRVAGLAPDETRNRVLEAAATVFADCGFEGARVAEIAKAAGVSVGAIYNHYQSKADLLVAVVECNGANDIAHLLDSEELKGLADLIALRGSDLNQGPPSTPLLAELILAARRDPEVADILRREVDRRECALSDLVQFGQSTGDFSGDVDSYVVARFCLMLSLGSLMVQMLGLPSTDSVAWTSFINQLVDQFRIKETQ